jgi:DNA polymerase I-like protein with 3'-5' exonuclease and polymerase domains
MSKIRDINNCANCIMGKVDNFLPRDLLGFNQKDSKKVKYLFVLEATEKSKARSLQSTLIRTLNANNVSQEEYVVTFVSLCHTPKLLEERITPNCGNHVQLLINLHSPERIIFCGENTLKHSRCGTVEDKYNWFKLDGADAIVIQHVSGVITRPDTYNQFRRAVEKVIRGRVFEGWPEDYLFIDTPKKFLSFYKDKTECSFDIETYAGLDTYCNAVSMVGSYGPGFKCPVVIDGPVLSDPKVVEFVNTCDIIFYGVRQVEFDAKVLFHTLGLNPKNVVDIRDMDYVLNEVEAKDAKRDLETLAALYCDIPSWKEEMKPYIKNISLAPKELLLKYTAYDGYASYVLAKQIKDVFSERESRLFNDVIFVHSNNFRQMSNEGITIDVPYFHQLQNEFESELDELKKNLDFNPNSPKQTLEKLQSEHLTLFGRKISDTNATTLQQLELIHPDNETLRNISKFRSTKKMISTYCEGILDIEQEGKIHVDFIMSGTVTGRPSSRNINIMNIPVRTEQGKKIKKGFIVDPLYNHFVSLDYSQLELRLAAIVSNDVVLLDLFKKGIDVHGYVGEQFFGASYNREEHRPLCKKGVFTVLYGASRDNVGFQMGISQALGRAFYDALTKSIFPGFGAYIKTITDQVINYFQKQDSIMSCLEIPYMDSDRVRRFPFITSKTLKESIRQAINSPIQGRGSDFNLDRLLAARKSGYGGLRFTVHDSVNGYCNTLDELLKIQEIMLVNDYEIPLIVEAQYGPNWAEQVKLEI